MSTHAEAPNPALESEMNALSLERALVDFEIANARVLDLTQRLVESTSMVVELQTELQNLRIEHQQLKAQHDAMKSSQAFRIATRIWALRNAVGG
jgi:uncharacterized protein (DUF3084 family)